MGSHVADLAAQFEAATEQVIALVGDIPAERWTRVTAVEGWTVAAVAHHIARAFLPETRLIHQVANREPIMEAYKDWAIIHSLNADNKARFAACTKAEVVDLVCANRAEVLSIVRGLTDAQLDNASVIPIIRDEPLTAGQLVEFLLIGHIKGHMASIRETIG